MKMVVKKEKEADKDDIGYEEEILLEGFSDVPVEGKVIKSFSFEN